MHYVYILLNCCGFSFPCVLSWCLWPLDHFKISSCVLNSQILSLLFCPCFGLLAHFCLGRCVCELGELQGCLWSCSRRRGLSLGLFVLIGQHWPSLFYFKKTALSPELQKSSSAIHLSIICPQHTFFWKENTGAIPEPPQGTFDQVSVPAFAISFYMVHENEASDTDIQKRQHATWVVVTERTESVLKTVAFGAKAYSETLPAGWVWVTHSS